MALETNIPCSVSNGLSLISAGNSLPSLRKPKSSRPRHQLLSTGRHHARVLIAMLTSETFGKQNFSRLTNQLVPTIAKKYLGLRIDQNNCAGLIDDDDGIRRRF